MLAVTGKEMLEMAERALGILHVCNAWEPYHWKCLFLSLQGSWAPANNITTKVMFEFKDWVPIAESAKHTNSIQGLDLEPITITEPESLRKERTQRSPTSPNVFEALNE